MGDGNTTIAVSRPLIVTYIPRAGALLVSVNVKERYPVSTLYLKETSVMAAVSGGPAMEEEEEKEEVKKMKKNIELAKC